MMLELSLNLQFSCEKPGSRVFEGFTVGYHPRSWEIAYKDYRSCPLSKLNIWTNICYNPYLINIIVTFHVLSRKSLPLFIAALIRTRLVFLLRAVWRLLCLAPRQQGVHRQLCLQRCQTARDGPYEVQLTILVEGYDPIQFSLTKMCEYKQNEAGTSSKGWALFGIFSCIFFVISTLFCCGGFIYKTQVQRQASMLFIFTLSLKLFFKICIFSHELLFNKSNMELMHCLA
ncbi:hypothetical protein Hanom_Chr15g01374161 [Helianthus anomalus]